jgi:hypothetical protein
MTGDKRFSIYDYDRAFQDPKIITKEIFDSVLDLYLNFEDSFERKTSFEEVEGKLLILSESDNTIPYELFDIIQTKFAARRIHLG